MHTESLYDIYSETSVLKYDIFLWGTHIPKVKINTLRQNYGSVMSITVEH